jgi:hypothetical protein
MAFKDFVLRDIDAVFNLDEFAEPVTIDGQTVKVIIDDDRLKKRAAEYGGITTGMILYFIPVSAFSSMPKVGTSQIFNNRLYYIESVSEADGVYEIVLSQNQGE